MEYYRPYKHLLTEGNTYPFCLPFILEGEINILKVEAKNIILKNII